MKAMNGLAGKGEEVEEAMKLNTYVQRGCAQRDAGQVKSSCHRDVPVTSLHIIFAVCNSSTVETACRSSLLITLSGDCPGSRSK